MNINRIDNTAFGASFVPNDDLRYMLTRSKIDKKSVRLSRRLARKWKGQELLIQNFNVGNELDKPVFSFTLKNLSAGFVTDMQYSSKFNFNLNKFLQDLMKRKGFFYLDKQCKVEHNLTGTKRLLHNLINQ